MNAFIEENKALELVEWPTVGVNPPARGNAFSEALGKGLLKLYGWRVVGWTPDVPKFVLIGAPHTSNWDYFLSQTTGMSLRVDLHFVMKHTPFIGPVGSLLRWLGGIPLDRDRSRDFVSQMVDEFNSREKFVLAITPEGTRTKVGEWRSGFYYIALGAKVPIVLVKFDWEHKQVRVGPALHPTGDYEADLAHIKELYAEVKGKHGKQV
jgi:1-acyl-sn-glycerol-3-phosphate acyltransferase